MDLREELTKFMDWFDRDETNVMTSRTQLIDNYFEFVNSCALDETQAVRQNEDAESKFKCLGHGTPQARWHDCPELCDECKPYQ